MALAETLGKLQAGMADGVICHVDVQATGDAALLRIVLENLIGNAWKFSSKMEEPTIELSTTMPIAKLRPARVTTLILRPKRVSIRNVPMMLVVLRKGTAAAHYVMGGPTANRHNAFTLGVATTEIYVMHGETAAAASFSRRLVKEKDAGRPLDQIIENMNKMVKEYYDYSRPVYCARKGFVDEVAAMT